MPQTDRLPAALPDRPWWKGAVIYQIYPRSFADSNGDGIGDLNGITAHLPYVASLGVDAIWLSPFFTSPMKDFGYDVADYRDVDAIFGTLVDFDALMARAHKLGLKVIIDQVYSHTSDEHPWFTESRSSRDNPKADWYVWADAKADGSPPSNWQSVFGGPAWTWDARRRQYYLHNFLKEQPQLHVHNGEVQDELIDTARFWLDRGVDGFRLDAINFTMHEPALTDNPPAPPTNRVRTRPFDFQLKVNNQSHADIPLFLERIRALLDTYGDRFTVAEVGGDDSEREMKLFTAGETRLNSAYSFDFLYAPALDPQTVAASTRVWPEDAAAGWPSWAFENHDAPRAISRWGATDRTAFAAMKMLLLLSLRGNVFLYYGEELGLPQVDVPFELLQDPEAIANWPLTLSRDGARTPMPWIADAPNAGFGSGTPWLPVGPEHIPLAVDRQEADPRALLHLTRRLIALRRDNPALAAGDLTLVEVGATMLVFERRVADQTLLCAFNMGPEPTIWRPIDPDTWRQLEVVNDVNSWHFNGYGAIVAERIAS
ncbi:alpha-glucosidase [Sphingomonas sp. Leaf17]|uniref:alpha-amylase family glycosyl hydrolase n=1 Tax=Sphingomonas sp. Leaf17 TaxID=1735683 RepID=UPI0006FD60DB|nr:alpha-amylase family glycosyl hydrolase [Sphingomonas sp. Leaf17]KQM64902.1 alpha-glucosidase [Sphingomonas sp. Leaf17]